MISMEEQLSRKITRSFVVHADIFAKFKGAVAAEGYSNFSEVIEYLIVRFLKEPEAFNLLKKYQ